MALNRVLGIINKKEGRGELIYLTGFSLSNILMALTHSLTHYHFSSFYICKESNFHNFTIVDKKHQICSWVKSQPKLWGFLLLEGQPFKGMIKFKSNRRFNGSFYKATALFFSFLYNSFTLSHTIMWCAEAE